VFPRVLRDVDPDRHAGCGHFDRLVFELHGLESLLEIARVPHDVDAIPHLERAARHLDPSDADLAVVVGDDADLLLRHASPSFTEPLSRVVPERRREPSDRLLRVRPCRYRRVAHPTRAHGAGALLMIREPLVRPPRWCC
jgi:hypothetical protein